MLGEVQGFDENHLLFHVIPNIYLQQSYKYDVICRFSYSDASIFMAFQITGNRTYVQNLFRLTTKKAEVRITGTVQWESHGIIIKRKHFQRYWRFVWGIRRSLTNSPHKGQWREALMFSLNNAWTIGWVNNRYTCGFTRHRAHYVVSAVQRCNGEWRANHVISVSMSNVLTLV